MLNWNFQVEMLMLCSKELRDNFAKCIWDMTVLPHISLMDQLHFEIVEVDLYQLEIINEQKTF
jgi:hypothetical protein